MGKPTTPQIYIYITEGGLTEWDITRGEIDVVYLNWDLQDTSPQPDDFADMRGTLRRIADPAIRRHELADLRDIQNRQEAWDRELADNARAHEQQRLAEARQLLRDAGEL